MNLKKFTKAELISKLKTQKSDLNNPNQTLFSNVMNIILYFKAFILKITLLALIIKLFKRYSIIRRIFTLFNTILFAIFGISIVDIYEIEFISKIFNSLFDAFSKFNSNLLELFGKRVEVPIETPTKQGAMRTINQSSTGNQESSKQDIPSLKDRLMKKFYGKEDENPSSPKDSSNKLIGSSEDKGKTIDFNNLTQSEIQERGLLQQPTVMRDITGNDFNGESASVLREIDSFLVQPEANNFPNSGIQTQLYDLLRGRLFKLSQTDLNKYQDLLQSDSVNNKIQNFLDLEAIIGVDQLPSPQSNTYDEIALATIKERDV